MTPSSSAGLAAYRGYEFQKLVTVWLALKLMCDEQRCDVLEVEPASEEDVAAKLNVDTATGIVGAIARSIPIEIQIKSRNKNWSESAFADVVTTSPPAVPATGKPRGPRPRPRALDLLAASPERQFLLITNAQLDTELDARSVTDVGERSQVAGMKDLGGSDVSPEVASRLAILPNMNSERVVLDIDRLLKKCGHVPNARLPGCRKTLMEEVHRRLLGEVDRPWPKSSVIEAMREAGGMPTTPPTFVPPANFSQLWQVLDSRHCIILAGGPGLGKTETARELVRLHQLRDEPFERVDGLAVGAGEVTSLLDGPDAQVFVFEDPWGSHRLSDQAEFWAKELPALMRRASATKRFVVTTRTAIRQEAIRVLTAKAIEKIEVTLKPEHYPEHVRLAIVDVRMAYAQPWQRDWMLQHRDRWLRDLTVPLSLDVLCHRVKESLPSDKLEIDDLIRECAVDVLAESCMNEVLGRGPGGFSAAIAFWALLHARQRIGSETPAEIFTLLHEGNYRGKIEAERTFGWLLKAGWLRPDEAGFAAHPTTMAGIEQCVEAMPDDANEVLQALLTGMTKCRLVDEAFLVLRHLSQRPGAVPRGVRATIERHLVEEFLNAKSGAARDTMSNIVTYSTATDPVTLLLKALDARQPASQRMAGIERWRRDTVSSAQREAIRASEEAQRAAQTFVLHALPDSASMRYKATDLVAFFAEFGWDFGLEFRAQCHVGFEDIRTCPNLDLLLECACRSEDPNYPELLDRLFVGLTETEKILDGDEENRRAIEQSEVNADASSDLQDETQELLSLRRIILPSLVKYRRQAEGWRWIVSDPRLGDLLWAWAESLDASTTDEEIEGLIAAAGASERPVVWEAVAKAEKVERAEEILHDLPTADLDHLQHATEQLVKLVPMEQWPTVVARLEQLPLGRRGSMAAAQSYHGKVEEAMRDALVAAFAPSERTALTLCRTADPNKDAVSYDGDVRAALLELAAGAEEELAARATFVLARGGEVVAADVARLRVSEDRRTRQWAVLAGMLGSPPALNAADLRSILADPDYRVARLAMTGLVRTRDPAVPAAVMAMHRHRSAPIRETCAELIGDNRWPDGVPILLELLRDRRDSNPVGYFQHSRPNLHVARTAATALNRFARLGPEAIESCLEFVHDSSAATRKRRREDIEVHQAVIDALAKHEDPRLVPAFSALLQDDWFVTGDENSGFPRRYVAGWSIFNHLLKYRARRSGIDFEPMAQQARHDDGRLAGPCIAILALCAESTPGPLLSLCPSMSPSRLALAMIWTPHEATVANTAIRAHLAGHPSLELFDSDAIPMLSADWRAWLAAHPRFEAWLGSIASSEDVNPALRWGFSTGFKDNPPAAFASDDLRAALMPKSIGSMTLWSMFHE